MHVMKISSTYGKDKGHFFNHKQEADSFKISANMPYIMLQKILKRLSEMWNYVKLFLTQRFILLPTLIAGKNSLHVVYFYMIIVFEMYCVLY